MQNAETKWLSRVVPRKHILWNFPTSIVMSLGARTQYDHPDEELVRLFQSSGDAQCFGELFARHRRRIYYSCRGFFSDGSAAEDAVQETFIRAFQNIQTFQGGNFGGWLMRISKNVCIDEWRKRRPETNLDEAELSGTTKEVALERMFEQHVAVEKLRAEIAALPPEQRQCLALFMDGYSYEEIAVSTRMPVKAVKSHIQNGRRMLWLKMKGTFSLLR